MTRYAINLGGGAVPSGRAPLRAGFDFPVPDALIGLHLLGAGLGEATRNYADFDGPRATVVGAPVEAQGYLTLSGSGYIQTLIPETLTGYHLILARRPNASAAAGYYGNFAGGVNPSGIGFFSLAASPVMHGSIWADGGGAVSRSLPASNAALWGLYGMEVRASGGSIMRDLVSGAALTQVNTGNRGVRADGARLRIGAFAGSVYVGACDVALVATLSRALTTLETAAVLQWARDYASWWPDMTL